MTIFLMVMLTAALLLWGGFFVYSSSILCVCMGIGLFAFLIKNKRIKIPWTIEFLGLFVIILFYIIILINPVDDVMAATGCLKFLPVLLWLILLYQLEAWQREKIVSYLPNAATVMVAASFVLSRIDSLEEYFLVNGRLSGTFQYPNTFAMFLLVSIIILCFGMDFKKIKSFDYVKLVICIAGLILSGSLSVLILFVVFVMYFAIDKIFIASGRKTAIIVGAIILLIISVLAGVLFATGVLNSFFDLALKSSTFSGRLLYWYDAVKIIIHNPLGLGYYGYFFLQKEYQTGLYSVMHVHNDLLQCILDIGIIPAIFGIIAMAKAVFGKNVPKINRVAMIFMVLHLLFDYDFQFISMFMIFVLLWDERKQREVYVPMVGKIIAGLVILGLIYNLATVGLADWYYSKGDIDKTLSVSPNHTVALTYKMLAYENPEDREGLANRIGEQNQHIAQCYDEFVAYAFSEGEILQMINFANKAIELEPYNYDRYEEYVKMLCTSVALYSEMGDYDSAAYCLNEVDVTAEKLAKLEERTSYFGRLIQDKMQYEFDEEVEQLIEETRGLVY